MIQAISKHYSAASITLHWLMLALIVAVYTCMDIHGYFPKGSAIREGLKTWHYTLGLTVFGLVWLRLLARLGNPAPPIEPAPFMAGRATAAKMPTMATTMMMPANPPPARPPYGTNSAKR